LRSWAIFDGPFRHALHRLNYRGDFGLGDTVADPLKDFVVNLRWQFKMVVPIPLGRQRRKEQGYNQIALVAYPVARCLGFSASQRKANVDGDSKVFALTLARALAHHGLSDA